MDTRRIAELLEAFLAPGPAHSAVPMSRAAPAGAPPAVFGTMETPSLSPGQLDQISIYIDLLLRWNARVNLTAIRTPEEIVTRHFGESLFAARHLLPCRAGAPARATAAPRPEPLPHDQVKFEQSQIHPDTREPRSTAHHSPQLSHLIDLGSGAGFPGVPMKIWSPQSTVTLIESNQKKVAFLREVIRSLTLMEIDVSPTRAEDHPPASATLVTLRAVERFEAILPTAARLLAPQGTLALLIGESQVSRAQDLLPFLQWHSPLTIPASEARILLSASAQDPPR